MYYVKYIKTQRWDYGLWTFIKGYAMESAIACKAYVFDRQIKHIPSSERTRGHLLT